jgi:thiol-disulfide isomerase/thioredoxin
MPLAARALAIGLVALAGVLAGFLSYRSAHAPTYNRATATGAAATPDSSTPDRAPAPAVVTPPVATPDDDSASSNAPTVRPIPDLLPELTLPNLAGRQTSLRQFLGHPLIINFWATWCAPCRREMPLLQQLRHAYHREGLEIVGIAVDFRTAVAEYAAGQAIDYPLLIGEDAGLAATEKFGMQAVLPFSVFADAQGRIVAIKVGELHQDEATYILGAMRDLAAGRISLAQAHAGIAQRLRELAVERAKAGATDS